MVSTALGMTGRSRRQLQERRAAIRRPAATRPAGQHRELVDRAPRRSIRRPRSPAPRRPTRGTARRARASRRAASRRRSEGPAAPRVQHASSSGMVPVRLPLADSTRSPASTPSDARQPLILLTAVVEVAMPSASDLVAGRWMSGRCGSPRRTLANRSTMAFTSRKVYCSAAMTWLDRLPHQPPMRLLDAVTDVDARRERGRTRAQRLPTTSTSRATFPAGRGARRHPGGDAGADRRHRRGERASTRPHRWRCGSRESVPASSPLRRVPVKCSRRGRASSAGWDALIRSKARSPPTVGSWGPGA